MFFMKYLILLACVSNAVFSFQTSKTAIKIDKQFNKKISGSSFNCPFSSSDCKVDKQYSNFNGNCNNLKNSNYGKSETPFKRLLSAVYDDGVGSARSLAESGNALPNPRSVSTSLNNDKDGEEPLWSHIFATFGQFLTHDIAETSMSSTDESRPSCPCGSTDTSCLSIEVTEDAKGDLDTSCMEFVRSSGSFQNLDCSGDQREQLNLINSFIDASTVYGNSENENNELRAFTGGFLLTSDGVETEKPYLPSNEEVCSADGDDSVKCFHSGDDRTTENLGLTGIHTVFLREHNRIAAQLAVLNQNWDDEKLFFETRKIIIGILQHIVYDQYVPAVIGREIAASYGLTPTTDGSFYTGYNSSVNPQLTSEFATAAMRYGHSLISNHYHRYNTNNELIDEELSFSDINFKSEEAYNKDKGGIDSIVMGLINTLSAKVDLSIASDLQNKLMDTPGGDLFDLAAFNINRGRDHGLQPYAKYVEYCTGKKLESFDDLEALGVDEKKRGRLSRDYESVNDIDLWIGGLAEEPADDAEADTITGPTFTCIIGEQFRDLKNGDRFYYENAPDSEKGTENTAFTSEQLAEIKKITFSTLLCNNLDISEINYDVFFTKTGIRPENKVKTKCSEFEQMDLTKWQK